MSYALFADSGAPTKVEKLDSGAIRITARVSRTGLQSYAPWPGAKVQGRPISVYRPASEVFSKTSLDSLKSVPITVGHPAEKRVDANTWKKYSVGHVEGHEVIRASDGSEDYVQTSLMVSDAKTVKEVLSSDLSEISQGYLVDLDWTAGTTDNGEHYDAIQTNIRHNHSALLGVGQARAGQGARVLLDMSEEIDEMTKEEIQALIDSSKAEAKEELKAELKAEADKAEADSKAKAAADSKAKAEADSLTADAKVAADAKAEAQKLIDSSEGNVVALLDTRDSARPMLKSDYSFEGKTIREIQTDCLAAHLPLFKVTETTADAAIDGAYTVLKGNNTKFVVSKSSTDGKENASAEHLADYHKRMDAPFEDSWSK